MPDVTLNWLAIFLAGVSNMVIGMIWYAPAVLGTAWMQATGKKTEDANGSNMPLFYLGMFVIALAIAFVLAHFVDYTLADTWVEGLITGLWVGVGFVALSGLSELLASQGSLKLWTITKGYWVVSLAVMGAILGGMQ